MMPLMPPMAMSTVVLPSSLLPCAFLMAFRRSCSRPSLGFHLPLLHPWSMTLMSLLLGDCDGSNASLHMRVEMILPRHVAYSAFPLHPLEDLPASVTQPTCCSGIFSFSTLLRSEAVDRARVAVSMPSIRVDEVSEARPRSALRPLIAATAEYTNAL